MPELATGVIIAVAGAYSLAALFFACGIIRGRKGGAELPAQYPPVSVIVAARNEEENLPACLAHLAKLSYPASQLEVIIVDDQSCDRTPTIARAWAGRLGHFRLHTIEERRDHLNGKANALHEAIEAASGDFLFITDADCRVPPDWIQSHLRYYTGRTAMVGGFALLAGLPGSRFGGGIQAIDWFFMTAVGAGSAGWGMPMSIFGNNVSIRKKVYLAAGGFAGAGFSVIEDFALMRAVQRLGGWHIKLIADAGMLVQSRALPTLRAFYRQRQRWAVGARQLGRMAKLTVFLATAAKVLPLALLMHRPHTAAGLYGIMMVADLVIAAAAATPLRQPSKIAATPLYSLLMPILILLLAPAYALGRTVSWKNREYTVPPGHDAASRYNRPM